MKVQFGRNTHGSWANVRNKSRDFDHSMSQLGTGIRGPSGRSRMGCRFVARGIKPSTLVLIFILRRQNAACGGANPHDPSRGRGLSPESIAKKPSLVSTDEIPYSRGPNGEPISILCEPSGE